MHREVTRRQPARRSLPCGARGAGKGDLQDRCVATCKHAEIGGGRRREGCGVEDDVRRLCRHHGMQERPALNILQAGDEHAGHVQPACIERVAQSCDRRGVVARDQCAIEYDQCMWTLTIDRCMRPEAGGGHRPRGRWLLSMADQMCGVTQRELRIVDATFAAIAPKWFCHFRIERPARGKICVPLHLARNAGEQRAARAGICAEALDAVRPVAHPAEHPQQHDFCVCQSALDIEIDRGRMPKREQIGQPQCRKIAWQRRVCG